MTDEPLPVLSASEERALYVIDDGTWTLGGRTDATKWTIHARVAEALSRKGLFVLKGRPEGGRTAKLTAEGRAVQKRLSEAPPKPLDSIAAGAKVYALPMDYVYANPKQPRTIFSDAAIMELADSIREHGQLQPIRVRPDGEGRYMIVLGERRWRAHQVLHASTIEATVVDVDDEALADAALVENLQRKDITPLEEAHAFQARLDTGISVEELARRLGIKQPRRIAERVALLRLSPEYQDALAKGILNPSQAGEMARLNETSQRVLFDAIRRGRCRSNDELRRVTQELLDAENQTEMFEEEERPTDEEQKIARGLEDKIERVCAILRAGFDKNEVVILRRVNPLNADVLADKLGLIESALKKLRLDLRAAAVARPAREVAAE